MTDATGIPRRSSEISLPWLNEVLSPPSPITSYQSDIIGGGAGVLGELSRVMLNYEDGEPGLASVVAKFASPVPEARQLAGGLCLYEMESRFYAEINHAVGIRIPNCYFNSFDPESQYSTLLLSDVQGEVADQVSGCTPAQASVALRNIAKVHAFGASAVHENPWLRELTEPAWIAFGETSLQANTPVSLDRMSDVCPAWLVDLAPTFHESFAELAARMMACGQTLIHGDLRADNLIFDASGEMTLLDWQLIFRAPGAYDVAYLLTQSLTVEDRRAHEVDLIREYRSVLESSGGVFDMEMFERAFRLATLYCLAYPLQAGAIIDENFERSQHLATAMLTRSCAAIEDYHCLDLI